MNTWQLYDPKCALHHGSLSAGNSVPQYCAPDVLVALMCGILISSFQSLLKVHNANLFD